MQAQFLPDIVIYWYAIETLYKLDHNLLKVNQYSNLFINRNVNRTHFKQDLFLWNKIWLHKYKRSVVLANDLPNELSIQGLWQIQWMKEYNYDKYNAWNHELTNNRSIK